AARGSLRTPQPNAAWTAAHNPLAGASSQYSSEQNSGQQNPSSQNPGSQSYYTTPTPTTVTAGATRGPAQSAAVVTAAAGDVFPRNPSERQHIPLKPPSDQSTAAESRSSSTLQMLFSVGSSLLIVTGLFLGLAWCYRKSLNSAVAGGLPKQVVHVLGRTSLSSRQQMVVLRFGNKLVLVSVIQGEARTLSEITDPLEVDQLVGLCESGQPGSISNSFKSVLLQEGRP
ncbi:MAG: flagellar biosynthetic protein FliO, partial [Planctomycetales bacterium]|nr:flagellar biosynthetic protein FliO [Planctomycetales bacterium]